MDYRSRIFKEIDEGDWGTLSEAQRTSAWVQRERNRYKRLASGHRFDVMVLPVQQRSISVDRVSRITSARFIADELRQRTGKTVTTLIFWPITLRSPRHYSSVLPFIIHYGFTCR